MQPTKLFACDKCDATFSRKYNLTRHQTTVHDKIKNFECSYCGNKYLTKNHLDKHIKQKHAGTLDQFIVEYNRPPAKKAKYNHRKDDFISNLEAKCQNLTVISVPEKIQQNSTEISDFLFKKLNLRFEPKKFNRTCSLHIEYLYFCKVCFSIYLSPTSYFYHNGISKAGHNDNDISSRNKNGGHNSDDEDNVLRCSKCRRKFENYCQLKKHHLPQFDNCNNNLLISSSSSFSSAQNNDNNQDGQNHNLHGADSFTNKNIFDQNQQFSSSLTSGSRGSQFRCLPGPSINQFSRPHNLTGKKISRISIKTQYDMYKIYKKIVNENKLEKNAVGENLLLEVNASVFKNQIADSPAAELGSCSSSSNVNDNKSASCESTEETHCNQNQNQQKTRQPPNTLHQCNLCNQTFTRKSDYLRHLDRHKNIKKFTCEYENCSKSFNNKSQLNQHVKIVHQKSMQIKCHLCQKKYANKSSLKIHLMKHLTKT